MRIRVFRDVFVAVWKRTHVIPSIKRRNAETSKRARLAQIREQDGARTVRSVNLKWHAAPRDPGQRKRNTPMSSTMSQRPSQVGAHVDGLGPSASGPFLRERAFDLRPQCPKTASPRTL